MKIMGIDPGLTGAVFVYNTDSHEFQSHRLESLNGKIDVQSLASFFLRQSPDHIFVEEIFLSGREGGRSAMTIGSNYGRIMAVVEGSQIPYTEVMPRVWQRALGLKGGSREIIKQSAQELAVKRFTLLPFLFGKSKKPHDGCTDAACIALYGIQYLSELLWTENQLTKSTQSFAPSMETSHKRSSTSKTKKVKPSTRSTSKLRKQSKPTLKQESRSAKSSTQSKPAGKNLKHSFWK